MKDFLYLKFLDRFKPLFTSMGIDYPTMRRILQLKLVMNGRRTSTVLSKGKDEGKNTFFTALIIYAVFGLFSGIYIFVPFPMFLKMNIVFGMVFFIILTTMISDFSSVLLDIQDRAIILTRPVEAKTLNAAKLMHIVYYLFSITMAIAGVPLIAGLIKYGFLFFLTMLAVLVLICSFTILFTSILYFLILNFFSGEKLKDIINYFQIALSIFMVVGYQVMGRIFNIVDASAKIEPRWWYFLLPSSWFASPFCVFFANERSTFYTVLALTGLVIPIIALIIYITAAAPAFEKNLHKLASGGGEKARLKKGSLMRTVSELICFNREERVFFKFTCGMLKSERKLKLRLLPNLTLGIIMPFVMMLSLTGSSKSFANSLNMISHGRYHLFIYMSIIFSSSLFTSISVSESFKGAWIYKAMPVGSPGNVLKGAMKAFIYKYVMPFYLLTCLIFLVLFGIKILPDLVLVFINMMILMLFIFKVSKKEMPFYKDFTATQGATNIGYVFLSFAICAALAAVHYFLPTRIAFGLVINFVISLALFVFLWVISFRISWKDIERDSV